MPRDMERYREWKRRKYEMNKEAERERKLKYSKENREHMNNLSRERYSKNKVQYLARAKFKRAVKKGLLIRPSICSNCMQEGKIEGHHTDYNFPLIVEWLCRSCHLKLHRGKRKDIYSNW